MGDTFHGYEIYDAMADAYAQKNTQGAFNEFFERPSTLALLPDVSGKSVLDLGSGPGGLASALADRGAKVTGVDGSEAMLAIARKRLGTRATFHLVNIESGLGLFASPTFDLVASSLTLHYLADLPAVAREIARVLKPGGQLVFSMHHPLMDFALSTSGNYFTCERVVDRWEIGEETHEVSFYRRPLSEILQAFIQAGFTLEQFSEGTVTPELRNRFPEAAEKIAARPFFFFCRFRLSTTLG
ncbi:class I SAM-dependent methyltransferase [bacterium]|nr:class I SAM-dependent methyltransferase [bacterium]